MILVDGVSAANYSGAHDYCFMSSCVGRGMVLRLPCHSAGEKCTAFLSTFDGKQFYCVEQFCSKEFNQFLKRESTSSTFCIIPYLLMAFIDQFNLFTQSQSADNERSPLLDSYLNTIHNFGQTDSSVANFYSPIESVHNSDSEADEDELYKSKGVADVQAAFELLECIDWKVEKIVSSTGDRIQSIQRKRFGKIYRLTGQVNVSAKVLLQKLYHGIEEMPSWNPTVLESKVLKVSFD